MINSYIMGKDNIKNEEMLMSIDEKICIEVIEQKKKKGQTDWTYIM